ncbi:MAG: smalltalk protein [Mediterranea sp.]|jgi:hypothetical protein|nr:smalltalk protein [Mediterranea sp.]
MGKDKKNIWKTVIQFFITVATAALSAIGVTSCM